MAFARCGASSSIIFFAPNNQYALKSTNQWRAGFAVAGIFFDCPGWQPCLFFDVAPDFSKPGASQSGDLAEFIQASINAAANF